MFQDCPDSVFVYRKVDNMNANATTYYVALCSGFVLYNNPEYHMLRGSLLTDVAPATEEAKQLLFNTLKRKNLMWDPKAKQVVRWRAATGAKYFYVSDGGEVIPSLDVQCKSDDHRFYFGNYFATKELAIVAKERIKENLFNI